MGQTAVMQVASLWLGSWVPSVPTYVCLLWERLTQPFFSHHVIDGQYVVDSDRSYDEKGMIFINSGSDFYICHFDLHMLSSSRDEG